MDSYQLGLTQVSVEMNCLLDLLGLFCLGEVPDDPVQLQRADIFKSHFVIKPRHSKAPTAKTIMPSPEPRLFVGNAMEKTELHGSFLQYIYNRYFAENGNKQTQT